MLRIIGSSLASGMATKWFLALPRAWNRLLPAAHFSATMRHTREVPTKDTPAMSGLSSSRPAAVRSPFTRLNTPGGKPQSSINSVSRCMLKGTCSDGFNT